MGRNRQVAPQTDAGIPIDERVRQIVSRTVGYAVNQDELSLARDLHLDGAGRTELLMAVELAFRIEFSESEAEVIDTVEELVGLVRWKTRSVALPQAGEQPPGAPADTAKRAAGG